MKIAFPSQEDQGLDSTVYTHFGSARYFLILEEGADRLDVVENADLDHQHGHCQPLVALGGNTVDAVVVGGIGGGALRKLLMDGIKVYRAVEGSVKENYGLIQSGKLPEFDMLNTCGGHAGGGGCAHH